MVTFEHRATCLEVREVPSEALARKDQYGGFRFGASNLGQYIIHTDFILRGGDECDKKWHVVPTELPCYNPKTEAVEHMTAEEQGHPNCYRLEKFIFEAFSAGTSTAGLETMGEDQYAKIRSLRGGTYPADTAIGALGRLHQLWIESQGGRFVDKALATDKWDDRCEVSPLVSYEGEDLAGLTDKLILPFYLPSHLEGAKTDPMHPHEEEDPVNPFVYIAPDTPVGIQEVQYVASQYSRMSTTAQPAALAKGKRGKKGKKKQKKGEAEDDEVSVASWEMLCETPQFILDEMAEAQRLCEGGGPAAISENSSSSEESEADDQPAQHHHHHHQEEESASEASAGDEDPEHHHHHHHHKHHDQGEDSVASSDSEGDAGTGLYASAVAAKRRAVVRLAQEKQAAEEAARAVAAEAAAARRALAEAEAKAQAAPGQQHTARRRFSVSGKLHVHSHAQANAK